jgi:hypothetical protein
MPLLSSSYDDKTIDFNEEKGNWYLNHRYAYQCTIDMFLEYLHSCCAFHFNKQFFSAKG